MITCDFENRGNAGLCDCLYDTIKRDIAAGLLLPDEKLPSKRSLALHLGISVITVANAYERLISEGYLYSIEKRGFFVTDLGTTVSIIQLSTSTTLHNSTLHGTTSRGTTPASSALQGTTSRGTTPDSSAQLGTTSHGTTPDSSAPRGTTPHGTTPDYYADFANNATSYEKFPFSLWSQTMRRILQRPHENLLHSAPPCGIPELQNAIADYLRRFRNMNVAPQQIVIGAGTEYMYSLLVSLLGRDTLYGVENPGYKKIHALLNLNGARCQPVTIDQYGMNPTLLRSSAVTCAHVSPSHHFPTGIVMPVKRRLELLDWAQEQKGRYIIEDDYDSEFRFNGKPMATLYAASQARNTVVDQNTPHDSTENRVIYVNTFSKTLAPSYRISYLVLPEQLVPVFNNQFGKCACTVSNFEQYALALFMQNGYYEKHIIRMKNYYRTMRNNLITAIQTSPLSNMAHIQEENAGLHFLLTLDTNLPPDELQHRFARQGLRIPLLSSYFYQTEQHTEPHADRTLVINYSGIKKERIPGAINRLATALKGT